MTVEGLERSFGKGEQAVRAVDGVTFEVCEGEFFGFLGPNGAGKSTTIKILTTLMKPSAGKVQIAGFNLQVEQSKIRKVIGYTGQSAGVDDDLTARENLYLMARLYHLPRRERKKSIEDMLEVMQLTEAANRPAYTYSGGTAANDTMWDATPTGHCHGPHAQAETAFP